MADGSEDNKYFDVAKPGKTAPDATSRPLIVGHKAILKQDPMMAEGNSKSTEITVTNESGKTDQTPKEAEDSEDKIRTHELTIKPPDNPKPAEQNETKPVAKQSASEKTEPTTDASNQSSEQVLASDEPKTQDTSDSPEANDETDAQAGASSQAGINEVAKQVEAKKIDEKAAKEAAEKQAALEKLVAEKKYYVPIGEKKRRRNTWVLLLVIVIAAAVGGYLAIDADLIKIDIELPVDLIKKT